MPKHPALRTGRHQPRRWRLRIKAAVARSIFGGKHAGLPFEPENRSVNIRLAGEHACVVHQIARGKVIRAVGDDVEVAKNFQRILAAQPRVEFAQIQKWIDPRQFIRRGIQFLPAHVGSRMNDLPLQVGVIHYIEIDQTQRAHARGCKIKRQRRSQPARANAQHARRFQLLLPLHADLRHDQMPRVAQDFVLAECHWNFGSDCGHKILD